MDETIIVSKKSREEAEQLVMKWGDKDVQSLYCVQIALALDKAYGEGADAERLTRRLETLLRKPE